MDKMLRYLQKSDIGNVLRTKAKKVLALEPYIDEEERKIAWNAGEILPLLGKIKTNGDIVVRSRKTGLDYVVNKTLAEAMLIEKI